MISYLSLRTRKAAAAIMFSSMWVGTVVPAYSMSKYDNVHSALNVTATGYRDGDKPRLNKDKNKHTYPGTEIVVLSEPGKRIISPKEKNHLRRPL